ncbi:MAG: hypothetical protein Q9184_008497 [Pyrenodesmia sp. 2 TL-2023]
MDHTSRNKENVPPPSPYPPSSPEQEHFADELLEGLENFDLFLRDRDAIMPPITPQRRPAMPAPEPDTPEFTEEGESDEPRTEEVEAMDEGEEGEEGEEEEEEEDPEYFRDDDPSLHGLRNINALASFHVSTSKPTCGVEALLAPTPHRFWQSDGPQPHTLTIHFFKMVHIAKFRLLLDWKHDESYTPTKMQFLAGTGNHDLTEFGTWEGEKPRGWVDVDLKGQGRNGGDGIWCMLVQVLVLENHQNGKDTHVRGCQVWAKDERVGGGDTKGKGKEKDMGGIGGDDEDDLDDVWKMGGTGKAIGTGKSLFDLLGLGGDDEPAWMKEPEIR